MNLQNHIYSITENIEILNALDLNTEQWKSKPLPHKWSKQEILGHLIDSSMINFARFLAILNQPDGSYEVTKYPQDELVVINDYQSQNHIDLLDLWSKLNQGICAYLEKINNNILSTPIILDDGSTSNLDFLVTDYIVHMNHHLHQIES